MSHTPESRAHVDESSSSACRRIAEDLHPKPRRAPAAFETALPLWKFTIQTSARTALTAGRLLDAGCESADLLTHAVGSRCAESHRATSLMRGGSSWTNIGGDGAQMTVVALRVPAFTIVATSVLVV